MWQRRQVLQLGVAGWLTWWAAPVAVAQIQNTTLLVSAQAQGRDFAVSVVDLRAGSVLATATLPFRGHQVLFSPAQEMVWVIERRPGTRVARWRWREAKSADILPIEEGYSLSGHAILHPEGGLLTCEQDEETERGLVVWRDSQTWRALAKWPSGGVGPHALLPLATGQIAVANGGILTHAETGRMRRNQGAIDSNVVRLDSRTGQLTGPVWRLPANTVGREALSLRHLAALPDGGLVVAMQFDEGKEGGDIPLLAYLAPDGHTEILPAPAGVWAKMKGYALSVATTAQGAIAATAPRGDCVVFWDAQRRFAGVQTLPKPAGVATVGEGFWCSNEQGHLLHFAHINTPPTQNLSFDGVKWDNHHVLASA